MLPDPVAQSQHDRGMEKGRTNSFVFRDELFVISLRLLQLLLHRVERFGVGRVHLLLRSLGAEKVIVEGDEDFDVSDGNGLCDVGLTGDESDELVEFYGEEEESVSRVLIFRDGRAETDRLRWQTSR